MIVVVIAGGSGTRLWPLSTHSYPKHLLSLTNDKSLLQNTISLVKNVTSLDSIFVVPEASHADHVRNQLKEIDPKNILVESARRGTASCFLLALSEIQKRGGEDEPVLFMWADHVVESKEGFAATVLKAGDIAAAQGRLVFIGVEPTYPSTGLGYLERGDELQNWQGAFELRSFKEKPDERTAEKYIQSGRYSWNTGYLVGTLSTFEREMQNKSPSLWRNYRSLIETKDVESVYRGFDSEPIDTALSEKVEDGIVIPGSFDWADIGSFKDLHEISSQDENGNHKTGDLVEIEDATNTYVRNENDRPVAVIGVDNIVVVSTPHGVLVTNKDYAQKVGDIAKKLQA